MNVSEAYARYISEYLMIKKQSEESINHYRQAGESFCRIIGDIPISQITMGVIAKYESGLKTEKHRCQNTIREYVIQIKMVLKYWRIRGEKTLNYELIPVPKKMTTVPTFLSAEEVRSMVDSACNLRAKFVISFLYSSGCRLSEMLQLNRGQIKNRQFTVVGKGDKARLCFIDERTERLMDEYLASREDACPALFVTRTTKTRMTPTNVQLLVKNAAKAAGIKKHVTPHTLRHSFATNYMENDGNIRYLSTLLGHASLNTTMHYSHVVDNQLQRHYLRSHTF